MHAIVLVDVCYVMLCLKNILCVGYAILWVTFVDVDMTQWKSLCWGDVFGVSYLFLVEVCSYYVNEALVFFFSIVLCREQDVMVYSVLIVLGEEIPLWQPFNVYCFIWEHPLAM